MTQHWSAPARNGEPKPHWQPLMRSTSQQLFWNKVDTPQNLQPPPPGSGFGGFFQPFNDGDAGFVCQRAFQTDRAGCFFRTPPCRRLQLSNRNRAVNLVTGQRIALSTAILSGWLEAEWRQPLMQGAGLSTTASSVRTPFPGNTTAC